MSARDREEIALEYLRSACRLLVEASTEPAALEGPYGEADIGLDASEPCPELHVLALRREAQEELERAAAALRDDERSCREIDAICRRLERPLGGPLAAVRGAEGSVRELFDAIADRLPEDQVKPLESRQPPNQRELRAAGIGRGHRALHYVIGICVVVLVPFGLLMPLMCTGAD